MATEEYHALPSPVMVNEANLFAIRRDSFNKGLSSNDISTMFNEFLVEFENMEKSGETTTNMFLNAVEEIADAVLGVIPCKLLDPRVLYHPLMNFLHQMLIDLLANWQASKLRLNIQETDIFLKIVLIFVRAAEQAPVPTANEDRKRIKDILATKNFLSLVSEQIIDNIKNQEEINDDPNICTLGLLTIKLLNGSPFYYTMGKNERLIDDLVISCLDSYDYLQAVRQLQYDKPLTDIDRFLLYTCWEYIPFVSTITRNAPNGPNSINFLQNFYDKLLTRFGQALNEPPPTAPPSLAYIFERAHQLLTIQNLHSFDKHANFIIDHLTNILQNSLPTNTNDDALIIIALEAFNNLSKNTDIRTIMKKRQLTSLFNKYTSAEMGKKRQLAFAILAQIMDEQEINNNPSEITAFFIDQLKQLDPNGYNPEVDSTLSGLNALMQHEKVKDEFVKQDGLETLISFIRDGDPTKQSDKQLEDALKILWSCTFNNPEALNTLQQDPKLMTRVNQLFENAKHNENSTLEKAAEGLIWKVEKEEKFKQQQADEAERKQQEKKRKAQETGIEEEEEEEEEEQYDCMISYSWADMDLAHRIFKHLTEKLGYKIWLDQEQMHGSTIQAMANAVEGAQFILMCMSDTYKRSANCQSEAEYAFNRKKHIVPIKMKAEFVADGWLGFILGTRMYIDFGTYDFDKAIGLLDNEIQLQKKKRKEAKEMAKAERKAAQVSENQVDAEEEVASGLNAKNKKRNMQNVLSWNEGNVRDFFLKTNLTAMLPLCDGINGEELSNLYEMCKTNSASMYRSLKFELLHGHHRILPISTFLRFISRMRIICDDGPPLSTHILNKTHENNFPDDE